MKEIINASRAVGVAGLTLIAVSLTGCGWFGGHKEPQVATADAAPPPAEPGKSESTPSSDTGETTEKLGPDGCPEGVAASECGGSYLFGNKKSEGGDDSRPSAGAKIGVNSYLWRASLDTVSFMPLISVDPFGGVIITDWYSNPNATNERFKMTVYVLSTELRADAIKVNLFRQVRGNAGWADSPADAVTASKLEDAILTRARELRLASLPQQ